MLVLYSYLFSVGNICEKLITFIFLYRSWKKERIKWTLSEDIRHEAWSLLCLTETPHLALLNNASHCCMFLFYCATGFLNKQYYLNLINIIINIILKKVVNLINLHKSAYLSVGYIGKESVNKIWDHFLFIFPFRYGEKKSVSRVLFIFHVVLASILLRNFVTKSPIEITQMIMIPTNFLATQVLWERV